MSGSPQPSPSAGVSAEIRSAMATTNELFNTQVFGQRNYAALEKIYTADARILPPGGPMTSGRQQIKEFWSGLIEGANARAAVLTSVDAMPAGEGVVEIGTATLTIAPQGAETQMEVKYVVFWKQEAGLWKWHVDIWNPNA